MGITIMRKQKKLKSWDTNSRFNPNSESSLLTFYGRDFEVFDISPPLSDKIAVFPGDIPFQRAIQMDFKNGDHLLVSSLNFSVHIGAHVDAPNHYSSKGVGIDQRSLHYYFGTCQIIDVSPVLAPKKLNVSSQSLEGKEILAPRILLKTGTFTNPNTWKNDFSFFDPKLITALSKLGVILVGIDTPSIDFSKSKKLPAHQTVQKNNMAILEGIDLRNVDEGIYHLIALPLRLIDLDASPVRAILLRPKRNDLQCV